MKKLKLVSVLLMIGTSLSCDLEGRTAKLEKQVKEVQEKENKQDATAQYDLQAKCAKDSKAWFNENWARDKDTLLLDFTNHYNSGANKCFILVEYHYQSQSDKFADVWVNDVMLWNIYENDKFGSLSERHITYVAGNRDPEVKVGTCQVSDSKCTSAEQFDGLVRPYMSN